MRTPNLSVLVFLLVSKFSFAQQHVELRLNGGLVGNTNVAIDIERVQSIPASVSLTGSLNLSFRIGEYWLGLAYGVIQIPNSTSKYASLPVYFNRIYSPYNYLRLLLNRNLIYRDNSEIYGGISAGIMRYNIEAQGQGTTTTGGFAGLFGVQAGSCIFPDSDIGFNIESGASYALMYASPHANGKDVQKIGGMFLFTLTVGIHLGF